MWPNPQFPADLVVFTEEILNGKMELQSEQEQHLRKFLYESLLNSVWLWKTKSRTISRYHTNNLVKT